MNRIFKIIILIFVISLLGCFGIITRAGDTDNISGWGWSNMDDPATTEDERTIGWVSFNSTNCDSDSDGLTDTGNYAQCPVGESISSYGVNIDPATGDLSGYAYYNADDPNTPTQELGWLSFNRSDTGNPPAAPFNGGSGPIAQYDFDTYELTGWMRALAACDSVPCTSSGPCSNCGGWDGWIRFCDDTTGDMGQCSGADQIVTLDEDGHWHGWAWSDLVVGWLSFNSNEGGGVDYQVTATDVVNRPPTASGLGVKGNYAAIPAYHSFSWTYSDDDGDNQVEFQFQVDDKADFADCPGVNCQVDRDYTGLANPSPTTNNQTVNVVASPGADKIGYATTYYWRVKVFDEPGKNSGWVEGTSFSTEDHQYPLVDFSWSPLEPSAEEDAQFTDASTCYDINNNPIACLSWSWTFEDGSPATSNQQNPIIQFTAEGSKQVTLQVTDPDGFSSQVSKTVNAQIKLPSWKEVAP